MKLQVKLAVILVHSILTVGQPVLALTLQFQACGGVVTRLPFLSITDMAWLRFELQVSHTAGKRLDRWTIKVVTSSQEGSHVVWNVIMHMLSHLYAQLLVSF